jgi:hypothetical protein
MLYCSFAQVIQNTPCENLEYKNCGRVSPEGFTSTAVKSFSWMISIWVWSSLASGWCLWLIAILISTTASLCYFLITRLLFLSFFCVGVLVLTPYFLFCVFYVFVFFVYYCSFCTKLPLSYFLQVYRPLPRGGYPVTVNKYHTIS